MTQMTANDEGHVISVSTPSAGFRANDASDGFMEDLRGVVDKDLTSIYSVICVIWSFASRGAGFQPKTNDVTSSFASFAADGASFAPFWCEK